MKTTSIVHLCRLFCVMYITFVIVRGMPIAPSPQTDVDKVTLKNGAQISADVIAEGRDEVVFVLIREKDKTASLEDTDQAASKVLKTDQLSRSPSALVQWNGKSEGPTVTHPQRSMQNYITNDEGSFRVKNENQKSNPEGEFPNTRLGLGRAADKSNENTDKKATSDVVMANANGESNAETSIDEDDEEISNTDVTGGMKYSQEEAQAESLNKPIELVNNAANENMSLMSTMVTITTVRSPITSGLSPTNKHLLQIFTEIGVFLLASLGLIFFAFVVHVICINYYVHPKTSKFHLQHYFPNIKLFEK